VARSAKGNVAHGDGRQALIVATVTLVAREGLSKLTYRSLAAEANVTHGTIQHHFSSLDEVLEEALNYALDVTLPAITEARDAGDFYTHLVDVIAEHRDVQAFQMEMILESRRKPRMAAYVKQLYGIYDRYIAESLAQIGLPDDDELAQLVSGVGDGIVYQLIALGPDHAEKARAQVRGLSKLIAAYRKSTGGG
jgi:AcrR family transcriptional regulator